MSEDSSSDFEMGVPMQLCDSDDDDPNGLPPMMPLRRHLRKYGDYALSSCRERRLQERRRGQRSFV